MIQIKPEFTKMKVPVSAVRTGHNFQIVVIATTQLAEHTELRCLMI